ncbi:ABC transporter permease [Roseibium sp. Sym1]|uniref:ABC transporter permease n=1 Tax=Roseibium sp. Sym1 TaxID=3016006 RepID=UPI0022B4CF37|nr:ABC transporter permease [Roseibium sp. Sym1]
MAVRLRGTEDSGLPDGAVLALSLAGLVAGWMLLSWLVGDESVLAGPVAVWSVIVDQIRSGEMTFHTMTTFGRVCAAFFLSMTMGTLLGITLGLMPRVNRWVDPWVIFFLNLPALVVIVLCYLWIGLNEAAAIVAVSINKTAMVAVTIREGVRSMDPKIADMANVYRMGLGMRCRHVWLPQLAPFFSAGVRNGLAVIWKIVLVVEFLGRPDGVGFMIHLYFQLFDIAHVLAYSLVFVAIMLVIEHVLVQPWESRAARWRVRSS